MLRTIPSEGIEKIEHCLTKHSCCTVRHGHMFLCRDIVTFWSLECSQWLQVESNEIPHLGEIAVDHHCPETLNPHKSLLLGAQTIGILEVGADESSASAVVPILVNRIGARVPGVCIWVYVLIYYILLYRLLVIPVFIHARCKKLAK